MKYRIVKTVAPDCNTLVDVYSNFGDAYKAYALKRYQRGITLEKKSKGNWVKVTEAEIAKKSLKPVEYKEIRITTPTDTYTFKLPRPVSVPSNIDQASAALYITLDLLGVKPTVKRKTVRK